MRGDPKEIAKMHWNSTLKHYGVSSRIGLDYKDMKGLVRLIHEDYGESLYPHTSHDLLIVKPMHRYDANCDELFVSFQNGQFKIEYILKQSKEKDIAFETSDDSRKVYQNIKPLLDKLIQSLEK